MVTPLDLEAKAARRRAMRARLSLQGAEAALEAGRAIDARLAESLFWQRARRIALFVSLPDEIATAPMLERALGASQLLLPRVGEDRSLDFCVVDRLDALAPGALGVLEPNREAPSVELEDHDLVVLPGLAFDREGGRLGRGAGYYDRVLARILGAGRRPSLIGVGYSFQLIDRVPMASHDVRVDLVVTETEWAEIRRSSTGPDPR